MITSAANDSDWIDFWENPDLTLQDEDPDENIFITELNKCDLAILRGLVENTPHTDLLQKIIQLQHSK